MTNQHIKYYKASFTGVFHSKEKANLPFHFFNDLEWNQLKIEDVTTIPRYDSWELITSNSWYRRKLKPYKNSFQSLQWVARWPKINSKRDFPWIKSIRWQFPVLRKRTHLIIPLNHQYQLQEVLHEVVLKRIELINKGVEWQNGLREAKGVIYFQIHLIPEIPKKAVQVSPELKTIDESTLEINNNNNSESKATDIWSINNDLNKVTDIAPSQKPLSMSSKGNRNWRIFMILWLLFVLWKFPVLFIPSLILFGAISFYRFFRKACLGLLGSLLIFSFIGYLFYKWLPNTTNSSNNTEKNDGSIRVKPPVKTRDNDLINTKEVEWWDFFKNFHKVTYNTSSLSFYDSQVFHEQAIKKITSETSVAYFNELYGELYANDTKKLDSIVDIFKQKIRVKRLSPIKSAEMVTTFIQEIPYFLVHDLDCKTVVETSNSDFMVQYHTENKPCLPNIPGGVQSPYEFAHNLMGDCDTRSLLGYTILKKLEIPCSVWVSEAYGHSVLGVGLPIGNGTYKQINGIKHYPTELTTKGFRLGMIAPEQQNMSNWDITLFFNR